MRPLACVWMALLGAARMAVAGPAPTVKGMETQLAGIQLGKKADAIVRVYGSPTRVQVGFVTYPGTQTGIPGTEAMPGMAGAEAGMMPGTPGVGMTPGAPGMEGMMPPAAGPTGIGPMEPGGAMGPAGPGAVPGIAGPEAGMGAAAGQTWMPRHVHWIYEMHKRGVVLIFGMDEEGRIVSVTVGDGYADSVNRGGPRRPSFSARTARGITIGDEFRKVVAAYGYPETQQQIGNEVVLTYYNRYGVAFAMRQGIMKVTAITIREMPKIEED